MAAPPSPLQPPPVLPTGVPGLDSVLGGGLLRGGTYLCAGPPGAGKTVLGHQLAFAHATHPGQVVYATLLTEGHGSMLAHLARMRFVEPAAVGHAFVYLSCSSTLAREGLPGLQRLLQQVTRERHATLLVLDGLESLSTRVEEPLGVRRFLQGLGTHNTLAGCTSLLLASGEEALTQVELAGVDGLWRLALHPGGAEAGRTLTVQKQRGAAALLGAHPFTLDEGGVRVWPRLEALPPPPLPPLSPGALQPWGVEGLEAALPGGGLPQGSAALVRGGVGTGKTLLALTFLARAVREGARALYLGRAETLAALGPLAATAGLPLPAPPPAPEAGPPPGPPWLEAWPPGALPPDARLHAVLARVEALRPTHLVLDDVAPLLPPSGEGRPAGAVLGALVALLRARGVTVVLTERTECPPGAAPLPPGAAPLPPGVDTLLELALVCREGRWERQLVVPRAALHPTTPGPWRLELQPQGLRVRGLEAGGERPPHRRRP